jgi:hypothetical protein
MVGSILEGTDGDCAIAQIRSTSSPRSRKFEPGFLGTDERGSEGDRRCDSSLHRTAVSIKQPPLAWRPRSRTSIRMKHGPRLAPFVSPRRRRAIPAGRHASSNRLSAGMHQRKLSERWNDRASRICLLRQLLAMSRGRWMHDGRSIWWLRHRGRLDALHPL